MRIVLRLSPRAAPAGNAAAARSAATASVANRALARRRSGRSDSNLHLTTRPFALSPSLAKHSRRQMSIRRGRPRNHACTHSPAGQGLGAWASSVPTHRISFLMRLRRASSRLSAEERLPPRPAQTSSLPALGSGFSDEAEVRRGRLRAATPPSPPRARRRERTPLSPRPCSAPQARVASRDPSSPARRAPAGARPRTRPEGAARQRRRSGGSFNSISVTALMPG